MSRIASVLGIFAIALCEACATIVNGARQDVQFTTEPGAAQVIVFNRDQKEVYRGTTPATAPLNRGSSYFAREIYTIAFVSPGRDPVLAQVEASLDGWYFGNFALGGAIGLLLIDPISGGMYELPEKVAADLGGHRIVEPAQDAGIRILTLDDLPPMLRSEIVPLAKPAVAAAPVAPAIVPTSTSTGASHVVPAVIQQPATWAAASDVNRVLAEVDQRLVELETARTQGRVSESEYATERGQLMSYADELRRSVPK